jgi:hypothetical protein
MMIHMPSIFFSHSKGDTQIVDYFSNIFTHIGLHGLFYEWQVQPDNYAGQRITNIICHPSTVAVFVLLGKNLERPPMGSPQYTHNWISFEVGVASGAGKPIWVFEEFGTSVQYPVPFVTDYAQYTLKDVNHLQFYGSIFQDRFIYPTYRIPPQRIMLCPYTDCNAVYHCWSVAPSFNCPVCRRRIPMPERPQIGIRFPANVV